MKHIILATAVAFTALPAWAQSSAESDSAASSRVAVGVQSTSNIYEDNRRVTYGDAGDGQADGVIRQEIENKTTGIANAPDMGSGHPCAIGGSVGVGIVGGAFSGGMMQVDEACMMVRSANPRVQAAGWALYAARDNDACKALRNAGVIARESLCGEKPEQQPATTSTRNVQVAYAKCELSGGKVVFRKKPGQDSAVARQQCLTSLGY